MVDKQRVLKCNNDVYSILDSSTLNIISHRANVYHVYLTVTIIQLFRLQIDISAVYGSFAPSSVRIYLDHPNP
jgi:hypothetical protein